MARSLLRLFDGLINFVVSLALLTAGAYAAYCLWDNEQIYAAAEEVQAELLSLKPVVIADVDEDTGPTFAELQAINPDVCAWVTLNNTRIDYPILQGATNLDYINTDVYGDFALAGSIFLDSRNDRTFVEPYSLLYGHHMENGSMFGDLDNYKDAAFFTANQTGTLILPDRVYSLQIFACMLVNASEDRIFTPSTWDTDIEGLLDYAEADAMHTAPDTIANLRRKIDAGDKVQVIAFTTCASEFTDARTIILAEMDQYGQEYREDVKQ